MYEFSVPMPYEKEHIDKLLEINNQVTKSHITSMFFSLPSNSTFFTGFEQYRNNIFDKDWDYWKSLITYCLEKEIDFIYLLNNPAQLLVENKNYEKNLYKLDNLLIELKKLGVNKIRIAEHRLMSYISEHYSDFDIYASTSFELKDLQEYQNFMLMHPTVKQIIPGHDNIKNFALLKNLKKLLKNTEIELMVNEGCIRGCPNRYGHANEIMDINIINPKKNCITNGYFTKTFCYKLEAFNPFLTMTKANIIYPWEIEEYSKLGINKFKLVGRDIFIYSINNCLNNYKMFLLGVDNFKNIKNMPINVFIHHMMNNNILSQLTVKDYKKYLPDIKHFIKKGHLCASKCGVECRYCYRCADKIQKAFMKKSETIRKSKIPFCNI